MSNDISAYAGTKGSAEVVGPNGGLYVLVYNRLATPATMALGGCYEINYADDATNAFFPFPVVPATESTVMHIVGIVNNILRNDGTILTGTWGYMQVKGYCENVLSSGNVVDERVLTTTNTTAVCTVAANATQTTATFGIAKGARTGAGLFPAYLFGKLIALT
jgi:hypothetical protein